MSASPPPAMAAAGTDNFKLSPVGNRWDFPLQVKAVILDLDGTMTPSYKTLLAIAETKDHLQKKGLPPDAADKFVVGYLGKGVVEFQKVLHTEKTTEKALAQFVRDQNIMNDPFVAERMRATQREAFKLYQGFKELQGMAAQAGVFFAVYTNSPDFFAARRMDKAGVDASKMHALWTKQHEVFAPGEWANRPDATPNVRKFGDILIPYTYKKPNDTPMQDVMRLTGIKPENILYIGEGSKDLESVYVSGKPSAVFAFHEQGARDICSRQQAMNEILRPGAEPLGVARVNQLIRQMGVANDVIRLPNGFEDVVDAVKDGKIRLSAPPVMPHVSNGNLVANGHPHRPAKPNGHDRAAATAPAGSGNS